MLNDIFGNAGWAITILVGLWMLQLWLSFAQSRRFHRHVMSLRRKGCVVSVGLTGTRWTLRVYAVLVVDKDHTVTMAQTLSGLTVFAQPKREPSLKGLPLHRFFEDEPVKGIRPRHWKAFRNAAQLIREADGCTSEKDYASIVVEQASSMPNGYAFNENKSKEEC